MSPRRRIEAGTAEAFAMPVTAPRRPLLTVVITVASVAVLTAVAVSAIVFANSQSQRSAAIREATVIDFVRSFVTQYTSLDPFNANAYADRVLAQGTGEFAKMYEEKMNEIVVQVARAEPGVGTVADLGIERWNDDGSASVIAVSSTMTTLPDGTKIPSANRWVVTAIKEGQTWKVSNLIQVI